MQQKQLSPLGLINGIPKNVQYLLATVLVFAAISLLKTLSFVLNLTADGIAYLAGTDREKAWTPFILATILLGWGTGRAILRLQAPEPANKPANQPASLLSSARGAFDPNSDFAKNLSRAVQHSNLFSAPDKQHQRKRSPAAVSSTRPPSPDPRQPSNNLRNKRKSSEEELNKLADQLCKGI